MGERSWFCEERERVKVDGWCLARAVLGDMDKVELRRRIDEFTKYVRGNINKYIDYLEGGWEGEMKKYVKEEKWDTDFVYNMPKML